MEKLASFAPLRPGMTRGDVPHERWRGGGASLAEKIPGLIGYVENRAVGPHPSVSGASEEEVFFEGYACAWFADRDRLKAAVESAAWQTLSGGSDPGTDSEPSMSAIVEERALKEGERSPFKAVWVLRFRDDIDRDWARDFWTNDHARFVLDAPGVDRYLQNHVVATVGDDDSGTGLKAVGFDGFAECWFQDRAAFLRAVTSPQWEGLVADGANLFDMSFLWGAVIEEHIVKG